MSAIAIAIATAAAPDRTLELEAANRELQAFSWRAAHDLKTPLNAVRGFLYLLSQQYAATLPDDARVLLQYIDRSAADMGTLIDALLALSRAEHALAQRDELDLSCMALDVFRELDSRSPEPSATLHVQVQPGLCARADRGLVRSLLLNLLGNARKFSARVDRPRVEFDRRFTERGAAFCVRDNGAGFEVGDPRHLFAPFRRFHPEDLFAGSGIGLATCRRIVLHHGGDIWLHSSPGAGTSVFFTLAPSP